MAPPGLKNLTVQLRSGDQRRLDSKVKVLEVKELRTELQVSFLFEAHFTEVAYLIQA